MRPPPPCSWISAAAATLALSGLAHAQAVGFSTRVTDNNRVGLTTSNYGFYGNDFISRAPSFEFPLGTGYEHMVRAGIWIGAATIITNSGTVHQRVTVGAQDALQGQGGPASTEWAPTSVIVERSKLANSRFYQPSPPSVSEQDFVSSFSDDPGRTPRLATEPHLPIGIEVRQEMYNWSFASFADIVFAHLTLRGTENLLDSVYVGVFSEMASGPKNLYSTWPPTATGGGSLGGWYSKKELQWDAARRLLAEHYCVDISNCNASLVPPWVGIQLLGVHPDTVANKIVGLHLWNFSPGDNTRDQDSERFALLSSPWQTPTDSLQPMAGANDPVELIGTGPFTVYPDSVFGDSTNIRVDFAFVGGETYEELLKAADFAQLAFNFDYIVPEPPPSPRLHVVSSENEMELFWEASPESTSDPTSPQPGGKDFEGYRVYIGEDRTHLNRVAQFDKADTTGFNTGLDSLRLAAPRVIEGDTVQYHYVVKGLRDGFKYFAAVTSYDTGDQEIESLESGTTQNKLLGIPGPSSVQGATRGVTVFPNPYKVEARWDAGSLVRDHYLWFANLPRRSHLAIYTLAGDLVYDTDFDGSTYHGTNARGVYDPRRELDVSPPTLSGSSFAWNLISREGQAVATGIYLYAVRDLDSGNVTRGKFLILKSDREGF